MAYKLYGYKHCIDLFFILMFYTLYITRYQLNILVVSVKLYSNNLCIREHVK